MPRSRPPQLDSRQRGSYRDDHGTPDWVLDMHRGLFKRIDLDLASSAADQRRVGAKKFYSVRDPCPAVPRLPTDAIVWCNPPGPSGKVIWFWETWCRCIRMGAEGSFLVFSIDHLRLLRNRTGISLYATFLPRIKFVGNRNQAAIASVLITTKPLISEFVSMELAPCNS